MANSDHWGLYWAGGALTSLPDDFAANYDGEIRAFWQACFAEVPEGGRILDVCTGNGAIALLAAEATRSFDRPPEILAVDAAAIRPSAVAERFPGQARLIEAIRFIPSTRFENVDVEDGSVDLITSQYGIEYCDLEKAATKTSRLLRSGGRLAIVSHAVSSDMLRTMEAEHADYRRVDRLQVLERVRQFLEERMTAAQFRRALGRIRAELLGVSRLGQSPLLRHVLGMAERTLAMPDAAIVQARPHYRAFLDQLAGGRDRLADMLRVNRMISENTAWFEAFERAGLELVEQGRIHYQGRHDVGRFIILRKP